MGSNLANRYGDCRIAIGVAQHELPPAHIVPAAELSDATFRYATRLALIAPEALVVTKLSVNRGADAGGFRNAIMAGLDIVAPLYAAATEVGLQFAEITRSQGLGAALKWRRAQFEE